jgi:hypothetical protein
VAYNFQTGRNKTKKLTEYEFVNQKVLFSNLPKTFCQTSKLMKIPFGDGYSLMKQRFTYQGGKIVITAEYRDQKTLMPFENSKEIVQS